MATKHKKKAQQPGTRTADDTTPVNSEVKPTVDTAKVGNPTREPKAKGEKRKTDNSNMYSGRMPEKWFDLLEILKTRKQPGQTIGDVLTETLERGMASEAEAELNATVHQHPTLDGQEYLRIRSGFGPISKTLKSFRADLLEVDQSTVDSERSEKLIELYRNCEDALNSTLSLNTRLARLALLPGVPSGEDLTHLCHLRNDFIKARNEASTPDERAKYSLALKLIGPYLP